MMGRRREPNEMEKGIQTPLKEERENVLVSLYLLFGFHDSRMLIFKTGAIFSIRVYLRKVGILTFLSKHFVSLFLPPILTCRKKILVKRRCIYINNIIKFLRFITPWVSLVYVYWDLDHIEPK